MSKDKLTNKEHELLCDVMGEIDTQLDEGYCEYAGCDENFIYLDALYDDGGGEELKLHRDVLNSGDSAEEIAKTAW